MGSPDACFGASFCTMGSMDSTTLCHTFLPGAQTQVKFRMVEREEPAPFLTAVTMLNLSLEKETISSSFMKCKTIFLASINVNWSPATFCKQPQDFEGAKGKLRDHSEKLTEKLMLVWLQHLGPGVWCSTQKQCTDKLLFGFLLWGKTSVLTLQTLTAQHHQVIFKFRQHNLTKRQDRNGVLYAFFQQGI